jgi:hypothetical protein
MLIGVTPFYNRNRNMLLMKIKNSKVIFPDKSKYKIDYSDEIESLINAVLSITLSLYTSYSSSLKTRPRDWGTREMLRRYWRIHSLRASTLKSF